MGPNNKVNLHTHDTHQKSATCTNKQITHLYMCQLVSVKNPAGSMKIMVLEFIESRYLGSCVWMYAISQQKKTCGWNINLPLRYQLRLESLLLLYVLGYFLLGLLGRQQARWWFAPIESHIYVHVKIKILYLKIDYRTNNETPRKPQPP